MEQFDRTDLAILRTLQGNAKLTTKELAAAVHLTPTPVFERLKRLERQGVIKKYVAVLDAQKLNRAFVVFCSVKLSRMNRDIALDFTRRIREISEVTECYNISGDYDYLLKINVQDMAQYQQILLNKLGTIESLGSLKSSFVMDEVKHCYGINL
ncbi:MAG: Lrp/AsnC family transcriptional regulator [Bacteroidaceae bacterium]|nr:Lrp/AsnC family transcriptional regulator [Bacteroidaceae bacterium]